MARRYPGSLIARVLVNRYYALQRKYTKPRTKPGRLDFVKQWFLHWEGLLIGGVFVGGLGVAAVKVYLEERLDDLGRREERCKLYEGSCRMAASHLASIQQSLALFRVLAEAAEQRSALQQHWQQLHQQRTQAAAHSVALWRHRTARWLGQPTAADAAGRQGGDSPTQQLHQPQQQQQQQQQPQQPQQQLVQGQLDMGQQGSWQVGSCWSSQQQLGQGPGQTSPADTTAQTLSQQQLLEEPEPLQQQQQQQQQQDLPVSTAQPQQQPPLEQHPGSQQRSDGVPTHLLQQQHQHQHQHQQHEQQQQRSRPAAWPDLVGWFLTGRLAHAQQCLAEAQQAAALCDRGLQLWLTLAQHAARQVERLERQEDQQLLLLLSHTAQRQEWQQLQTHDAQLEWWFDLPSAAQLYDWAAQLLQQQQHSQAATDTAGTPSSGAAPPPSVAAGAGASIGQDATGRLQHVWQRVRQAQGWFHKQQQEEVPADPGSSAQQPAAPSAGATAAAAARGGGTSRSREVGYGWVRIRLLLPVWVPNDIEERDFDLLCQDYLDSTADASGDQQQQQQQQQHQQEGGEQQGEGVDAAAGTAGSSGSAGQDSTGEAAASTAAGEEDASEDIELELTGGVIGDVLDEALGAAEVLWEVLWDAAA